MKLLHSISEANHWFTFMFVAFHMKDGLDGESSLIRQLYLLLYVMHYYEQLGVVNS